MPLAFGLAIERQRSRSGWAQPLRSGRHGTEVAWSSGTACHLGEALRIRQVTKPDPDFESFRGDLIAYLADRLELSPEAVAAKLGDLMLERRSLASGASRLARCPPSRPR
jgi:hypothetical protein